MATLKCKELLCLLYSGLLFISGAVLVGLSIVLAYKLFYHYKFVPAAAIGPFILILFLGLSHILITWLAVKGPTKEHDFHIILFISITIALFLLEIGVGIWSMILWSEVPIEIDQSFNGFIKEDFDKYEWARLQTKLQCCGNNNSTDYFKYNKSIPVSCFVNHTSVYEVGCKTPFIGYVKSLLLEIGLVGFFAGLFQVLGVMAFYSFYKSLKEERIKRRELRRQQVQTISRRSTMRRAPPPPPPVSPSTTSPLPPTAPIVTSTTT